MGRAVLSYCNKWGRSIEGQRQVYQNTISNTGVQNRDRKKNIQKPKDKREEPATKKNVTENNICTPSRKEFTLNYSWRLNGTITANAFMNEHILLNQDIIRRMINRRNLNAVSIFGIRSIKNPDVKLRIEHPHL